MAARRGRVSQSEILTMLFSGLVASVDRVQLELLSPPAERSLKPFLLADLRDLSTFLFSDQYLLQHHVSFQSKARW